MAPRQTTRWLKGRLLRGCNVHHRATVFVQRLVPGALAARRVADAGPDFARRFVQRFGGLDRDSLPVGTRAALEREPGLPLTEVLLEGILAVERFVAGAMRRLDLPAFATVVPGNDVVELVWSAHAGWVSRAAAGVALSGLIDLLPEDLRGTSALVPDFASAVAALRRRARRHQWSPTVAGLAFAARQRGLAHELLAGNYLRIGEGVSQLVVSEDSARLVGGDSLSDGGAILDLIIPEGARATIPTALVVGERGTGAVARRLDGLLRTERKGVGLAVRGRTTIQGRPVDPVLRSRRAGAEFLLSDPRVGTVIAGIAPRRIVARGLGIDHASVVALLDPAPGSDLEVYRAALAVSLAATSSVRPGWRGGTIVIGADNPYAELVLASVDPARTIVATRRRRHPVVQRHAALGGGVVRFITGGDGRAVEVCRGPRTVTLLRGGHGDAHELFTAGLAVGLGGPDVPTPSAVASRGTPRASPQAESYP